MHFNSKQLNSDKELHDAFKSVTGSESITLVVTLTNVIRLNILNENTLWMEFNNNTTVLDLKGALTP